VAEIRNSLLLLTPLHFIVHLRSKCASLATLLPCYILVKVKGQGQRCENSDIGIQGNTQVFGIGTRLRSS